MQDAGLVEGVVPNPASPLVAPLWSVTYSAVGLGLVDTCFSWPSSSRGWTYSACSGNPCRHASSCYFVSGGVAVADEEIEEDATGVVGKGCTGVG